MKILSVICLMMFSAMLPADKSLTEEIKGVPVDFIVPSNCKGAILVLPGWNFNRKRWCEESSLCKKALAQGYALILPEMGKSVYASEFFPETREDYKKHPDLNWVNNELLPYCRKLNLLKTGDRNFIVGLSTGGRGVALITLSNPGLFKTVAALSGDYDQSLMGGDKLMEGYYGLYCNNVKRWNEVDNPVFRVGEWNTPIYIGHGAEDKVVPLVQTEVFVNSLARVNPSLDVKVHVASGYGHDFKYWDSEVDAILEFFKKY